MAALLELHKTTPVVNGATLKFTKGELDYLRVALKSTYKADQDVYPFSGIEHKLYKVINDAYNGRG